MKFLLGRGIDSLYLIRTALSNGLAPLLYWNLNTVCSQVIPSPILDQLRAYFEANARRNTYLADQLIIVLELLQSNDILSIPFKGPALAVSAYGDLAFREITDLDIFVDRRDFTAAKAALKSRGYHLRKELSYESTFVCDDAHIAVDLHTGIITPQRIPIFFDFERLRERAQQTLLGVSTVARLSPEHTLIVLSVQVATDRWLSRTRILQIADINAVIESNGTLDWREVIEEAQNLGCQRVLLLGVGLANELFGTSVPEEILQNAKSDRQVEYLAKLFLPYFSGKDKGLTPVERFLFQLHSIDRVRDQISYTKCFANEMMTPNARDRALLRLPERLSFCYYVFRPIRLLLEYGLSIGRYAFRESIGIVRIIFFQKRQSCGREATS
jgi:Uncharacterised nucleotidyltransferase